MKTKRSIICFIIAVGTIASCWLRFAIADEAAESEIPIQESDRSHWAFSPLTPPEVPYVNDTSWPRNAIDHYILARLREEGLSPAPQADRETLIRRATFDLIGLPPTPDEVEQFVSDKSPDAYEKLIDRLLASNAYGERWAQHWLDLARYAESDGFEHDLVRKTAWKYRDWVINALNADMPYGEFVRQQIAGDLLYPDDPKAAIATGFVLAGPDMPDINLTEERQHMILNDISATVGSVFLGLQTGCAECHDHKTDPISHADFYRLRAFFENSMAVKEDRQPGQRKVKDGGIKNSNRTLKATRQPANHQLISYVRLRGDFRRKGPVVEPAFPRIAVSPNASTKPKEPTRIALANWLADDENFLASRVEVNRLWQEHFGEGLVLTPGDFGLLGESPSHPELLDWLAAELGRKGGSLKKMHKLMMLSATYRQASRPVSAKDKSGRNEVSTDTELAWTKGMEVDPENRLLWHSNRKRLEGEIIRDSILAVSDRLNSEMGGPSVMPPLPEELVSTLLKNQWVVSEDEKDHRRRSIYIFARRNLRYPIFEAFDRPSPNASCAKRPRSTIAPQALLLLNSEFSMENATALANLIIAQHPDSVVDQITLLYQRTLSRKPTAEELARGEIFLTEDKLPHAKALSYYCLAMFNLNEFIYVD